MALLIHGETMWGQIPLNQLDSISEFGFADAYNFGSADQTFNTEIVVQLTASGTGAYILIQSILPMPFQADQDTFCSLSCQISLFQLRYWINTTSSYSLYHQMTLQIPPLLIM